MSIAKGPHMACPRHEYPIDYGRCGQHSELRISHSMTEVPLTRLISGKVTGTNIIPLLMAYRSMSVVCG